MYSREDETGWRQSAAFKKAFSIDVDIQLLAVWWASPGICAFWMMYDDFAGTPWVPLAWSRSAFLLQLLILTSSISVKLWHSTSIESALDPTFSTARRLRNLHLASNGDRLSKVRRSEACGSTRAGEPGRHSTLVKDVIQPMLKKFGLLGVIVVIRTWAHTFRKTLIMAL